jgi:Ca-activated chloride channel family protein
MEYWVMKWFAYPQVFWLAPGLGVAVLLAAWGWRQRGRALAHLGEKQAVRKLLLVDWRWRGLRQSCLFLGLFLLLVGSAGPQWGRDLGRETSQGHDVVLVLDVSRSMLAEQPSRLERAVRALGELADHWQRRGGQRLALVLFAARPHLAFPLTQDYDHLRFVLAQIEKDDLPATVRPPTDAAPLSGTRLGAALRLAVEIANPQAKVMPAIFLLSDGDDPAGDEEWLQGVQEARAANVPVHTVGLGDPRQASPILMGGEFLQFEGQVVRTRLEEKVLQDIAQGTGGVYIPAHTSSLPWGRLFREILQRQPRDDMANQGRAVVPVYQQRPGWFLWPGLGLLLMHLLWRARPQGPGYAGPRSLRLAAGLAAVLGISAAPIEENLIREGNGAFARGQFKQARDLYEKAEAGATDPGLVAFNKAGALYRLGQYPEATEHYLRCLEDDQIPSGRRNQAYFGLGISLLKQAGEKNVVLLDRASDALASCLEGADLAPELATDAQHNLELARWLRFRAGTALDKTPPGNHPLQEPKKPPQKKSDQEDPGQKPKTNPAKGDPDKRLPGKGPKEEQDQKKLANPGALQMLPDVGALVPMPPENTAAYLQQLAERIREERRAYMRQSVPVVPRVKDW